MALEVLKRNSRLREVVYENEGTLGDDYEQERDQIPWPSIESEPEEPKEPKEPKEPLVGERMPVGDKTVVDASIEAPVESLGASETCSRASRSYRRLLWLFIFLVFLLLVAEHVAKKYTESCLLYKWNSLGNPIPFAPTLLETMASRAEEALMRLTSAPLVASNS